MRVHTDGEVEANALRMDAILGRTSFPLAVNTMGWAAAISGQLLPCFLSHLTSSTSTLSTTDGRPKDFPSPLTLSTPNTINTSTISVESLLTI